MGLQIQKSFFRIVAPVLMLVPCAASDAKEDPAPPRKEEPGNQVELEKVEVRASRSKTMVEQKGKGAVTEDAIPRATIDLMAGPAQINPAKALDLLPSVHSETSDAFGLVNDQNNIRIRGQYGDTFTRFSRNIEGLPVGVNVGQGVFGAPIDLENLAEISLVRGAIPSDQGFGFGDAAGSMNQALLMSSPKFGITFRQNEGSNRFTRTFLRVDSGELPGKTSIFASGSYTAADKWRGPGDGDRTNLNLGIAQILPGNMKLSFFGAYNRFSQDMYRPLTYAQASDSSYLRGYDYNGSLTGNALTDINYYAYNHQDFKESLGMMLLEGQPTEDIGFTIKPYFYRADGVRLAGSGTTAASAVVQRVSIVQDQVGVLAEFRMRVGQTTLKAGYWYQNIDTMPPPKEQKNDSITPGGLVFKSWGMLTKVGSRDFHEPYVMASRTLGSLKLDGGLKYAQIGLPGVTGYGTTGLADVSYATAINSASPAAGMHADGSTYRKWLPYAALSWNVNPQTDVRLAYGRNYASPWLGPLYSTYASSAAKFQTAGVSLQQLWNSTQLETANSLDLGLRYDRGWWFVAPTLFYTSFSNKQVPAYDPLVGVTYYMNQARAEARGAELEAGLAPMADLTLFSSLSYNDVHFTQNILSSSTYVVQAKGKQMADSPKYMAKLGVSYAIGGLKVSPVARYIGKRYGDIENKELVASYKVADLNLDYTRKGLWGLQEASLGLSCSNLFDAKYVGIIKVDQDASQALSTQYYPGAPRTLVASLRVRY